MLMAHKKDNLGKALLVSLALHAAILSLQFGVPGKGLPWLRMASNAPQASAPMIQATMVSPAPTIAPPPLPPVIAEIARAPQSFTARLAKNLPMPTVVAAKPVPRQKIRRAPRGLPVLSTRSETSWRARTAEIAEKDESEENGAPSTIEDVKKEKLPEPVIVEDSELKRKDEQKKAEALARIDEEKHKEELAVVAKAADEARERKKTEALARVAEEKLKQEQAAIAKATEEARERKRAEDLARAAEEIARAAEERRKEAQTALARAAEEALERRRSEALASAAEERRKTEQAAQARLAEEKRKEEQAALASAQQEALARASKAEAMERVRLAEAAAAAKAERDAREMSQAAERTASAAAVANATNAKASAAAGSGKPSGAGKQGGPGVNGADLARRAMDMAKNGFSGLPLNLSVNAGQPRRASILGRNPSEVQLAFYNDSWVQKVERIGSQNYPHLSKNRHYDPLLVTVSINSDGSIAGVRIVRSSGVAELDNAVRRIIELCRSFAAFPPDLKRNYDFIDITRTWVFEEGQPLTIGP